MALTAGCAPDSVRNIEAQGFDAYLDSPEPALPEPDDRQQQCGASGCAPTAARATAHYVYRLDQTLAPTTTASHPRSTATPSVGGRPGRRQVGQRAVDCIIGSLPAQRPTSPASDKRP
ncbi:hypothetical protein ACU4GD_00055 [Cupriavidus basilensis]